MVKKNKTKKLNWVPFVVIGVLALGVAVFGLVILSKVDLEYENRKLECEQNSYSSLIRVNHEETPGNENINSQIDTVKRAMDSAREANDVVAFGQLWEQYNDLLDLQAQTNTTNETYDYSEVDKAKSRCRTAAKNRKQMDFQKGLWLTIPSLVVLCADVIVFLALAHKQRG